MTIFIRPRGGLVKLAKPAEKLMRDYAAGANGAEEAGGVLLGRLVSDSKDIVIDAATEPGPNDKRTLFSFLRSKAGHQQQVNRFWAKSGGTQIYLGGWHSHPQADPTPSGQDIRDWLSAVKRAKYEQDSLLFAIVGFDRLRLWELARGERRPVELPPQP